MSLNNQNKKLLVLSIKLVRNYTNFQKNNFNHVASLVDQKGIKYKMIVKKDYIYLYKKATCIFITNSRCLTTIKDVLFSKKLEIINLESLKEILDVGV